MDNTTHTPPKDSFNPYIGIDGKPREIPLYIPKYMKTIFTFSPENAREVAKQIRRGEYHTFGNFTDKDGTSQEHAFLVISMKTTGNPDEYVLLSEDYGVVQ